MVRETLPQACSMRCCDTHWRGLQGGEVLSAPNLRRTPSAGLLHTLLSWESKKLMKPAKDALASSACQELLWPRKACMINSDVRSLHVAVMRVNCRCNRSQGGTSEDQELATTIARDTISMMHRQHLHVKKAPSNGVFSSTDRHTLDSPLVSISQSPNQVSVSLSIFE